MCGVDEEGGDEDLVGLEGVLCEEGCNRCGDTTVKKWFCLLFERVLQVLV